MGGSVIAVGLDVSTKPPYYSLVLSLKSHENFDVVCGGKSGRLVLFPVMRHRAV
jgi:hypothetical protein